MADDEQFSLCWNNFNSNLSAGFHDSLVQGDLVDVTLAAEGHLVKAHRLILSVCSPYFRKMFMQMPVNQHAFIFLKDVSHSVLKDLIQFMYCGEVNVKQEALPGFISTAEALQIKGLTETGDSAPPQASPAKEIPSTPAPVSISTANTVPPRGKSQRTRVQSFKLESEESGDDKIVQIQTPASHHHSASASQQVQQVQQLHVASGQKRVLGQRHVQASQITKRAKISLSSADVLDPSDNTTQIQTVQIIKQLPSQPAEPEYVDLAMEAINAKPEPDYAEEPAEIETVEAETEQDQSLTENEQTADQEQEHGDDGDQYVDDDAYGELSKYEESYFTEAEDAKPGASGFGESYASDGTSNEQTSQDSATAIQCSVLVGLFGSSTTSISNDNESCDVKIKQEREEKFSTDCSDPCSSTTLTRSLGMKRSSAVEGSVRISSNNNDNFGKRRGIILPPETLRRLSSLRLERSANKYHEIRKSAGKPAQRKRCVSCFNQSLLESGAKPKPITKWVTTYCDDCPEKPFLCILCFSKIHCNLQSKSEMV
ncbi:modifier of mdg4-like isoform X4 [Anopheles aquasalis]|uniref:modifier of mdg4-like isoform X4 n=1 Tax=Anopheles aquasalis TaxID=42839 RepID=UPI00215A2EE5|nr:modifier of mdg4-like isoform X4 [Anopheles aquasalis]